MTGNLHSPRWHRVASLRPCLSPLVQVRRQRVRGERWIVLSQPAVGRSVRLNAAAYGIAARLDGRRTVAELWDWQLANQPEAASQDEVIDLLAQLREASLATVDRPADFERLLPHLERTTRPRARNTLLAWRVPLANPTRLLDRLHALPPLIFSRTAGIAWLLAVCLLLWLALQHAPTLWAHGVRWMPTPRLALLAAILYVPVKLLHELAHGLAVRRWGGAVREAGVTFMLGLPVPYVDASAASGFERRRERVLVGAAGMMAELALAAVALPLWLWLEPGLMRDAAFVTLFITGVSTLLFNANPLQRLDGYYIATDLLGLPNLAPRSRQWWMQWLLRCGLRVPGIEPMPVARGETPWLAAYAPLSWAFGLFIAALAVVWLGQVSLMLGLLCAALLGWQMMLRPIVSLLGQLRQGALARQASAMRWRRAATLAALAAAALLALPLPQRTLVQGVVWPSDQAQLRAEEDGFVAQVLVQDGQTVRAGELVLQLANPALQAQQARQQARIAALETELFDALPGEGRGGQGGADGRGGRAGSGAGSDPRSGDLRAELAAAQAAAARLQERLDALAVRAFLGGQLALPQAADLPGQFLRRGQLLGQVLDGAPPTVRVAWPESQAGALRATTPAISVRLATDPGEVHAATLLRDGAGAVQQLPSAALSTRHGGDVPTDPQDREDLKPLQPVVLLDVRLHAPSLAAARERSESFADAGSSPSPSPSPGPSPGPAVGGPGARIGERAWVRFDTGWSPLALRAAIALQRETLQRFNPQF